MYIYIYTCQTKLMPNLSARASFRSYLSANKEKDVLERSRSKILILRFEERAKDVLERFRSTERLIMDEASSLSS